MKKGSLFCLRHMSTGSKLPLSFHSGWLIGISLLDYYNPLYASIIPYHQPAQVIEFAYQNNV